MAGTTQLTGTGGQMTEDQIDRALVKLRHVSETRERHRQMARTAAQKEKDLVLELVASNEVSIAELGRITGRTRQTIYNWTTRHPGQGVSGD